MARLTPEQLRRRDRIEALIALAAPVLDAVLSVSDRVSRLLGPESDYYPIRPAGEAFELPPTRPAQTSGKTGSEASVDDSEGLAQP